MIRSTLSAIGALFLIAGCATVQQASQPVDMTALAQAAFVAKSTYIAAMVVEKQILDLERCDRNPKPPCVWQSTVDNMRKIELAADAATQSAENAVRSLGSDPALVAVLVAAATNAANGFKTYTAANKVK